jgi:hypothetical protein
MRCSVSILMDGPLATSAYSLYILYTLDFVDHALDNSRTFAHRGTALFSVVVLATRPNRWGT